jgi:hypothetical protein
LDPKVDFPIEPNLTAQASASSENMSSTNNSAATTTSAETAPPLLIGAAGNKGGVNEVTVAGESLEEIEERLKLAKVKAEMKFYQKEEHEKLLKEFQAMHAELNNGGSDSGTAKRGRVSKSKSSRNTRKSGGAEEEDVYGDGGGGGNDDDSDNSDHEDEDERRLGALVNNEDQHHHHSIQELNIPPNFYNTLTKLKLSSNKLSGRLPHTLSKLKVLVELKLDGNQFTGPIITPEISSMVSLHILEVSDNKLTGSLQDCLELAKNLTNIKSIGWGTNQLTGNFGNYFGDDDDEISLLFPFEGLTPSEHHFATYGSFADPFAPSALAAASASSAALKSNNHNGNTYINPPPPSLYALSLCMCTLK